MLMDKNRRQRARTLMIRALQDSPIDLRDDNAMSRLREIVNHL
jgi:hypothetical protein